MRGLENGNPYAFIEPLCFYKLFMNSGAHSTCQKRTYQTHAKREKLEKCRKPEKWYSTPGTGIHSLNFTPSSSSCVCNNNDYSRWTLRWNQ